ncbi:MAG: glycosyltransferase family 2 protein, partial [bacterium]
IVNNGKEGFSPLRINSTILTTRIISEFRNHGYGSANNLGVKHTSGKMVVFINPDIKLRTDITKAIQYLKDDPTIGLVGVRLLNPDGTWQRSYGNFPTLWRKFCDVFILPKIFRGIRLFKGIHEYIEYTDPTEVDWVSGAFMIIKREAFEQVNGFDEDYFLYLEDVDLCKRIKDKGWKIVYYPYVEAIHYLGGETKMLSTFVIDHGDSPYIYFKKHFGKWSLPILWTLILTEAFFKFFIFGSISIVRKKYKKSFSMYWNTLKFSLLKSPLVIYKLIRH